MAAQRSSQKKTQCQQHGQQLCSEMMQFVRGTSSGRLSTKQAVQPEQSYTVTPTSWQECFKYNPCQVGFPVCICHTSLMGTGKVVLWEMACTLLLIAIF